MLEYYTYTPHYYNTNLLNIATMRLASNISGVTEKNENLYTATYGICTVHTTFKPDVLHGPTSTRDAVMSDLKISTKY
jgi:hypothetical protein